MGLAVVVRRRHRLCSSRRDGRPVRVPGRWAVGALAVPGVLGGFWYIRNYVTYRNPVYPVSMLGFGGRGSFDQIVRSIQAPIESSTRSSRSRCGAAGRPT